MSGGAGAEITSSAGLRDVVVPVLSNAECEAVYGPGAAGSGVLCTSGAGARGPCGGDGGGPLALHYAGRRLLVSANRDLRDGTISIIQFCHLLHQTNK